MLNISGIHEGFVLDHIQAGMSMQIYHDLKLDKLDCTVAIIKNARSNKMGVKDIIKVECPIEKLDLDILGFIDHNITVNIIKDELKKSVKEPIGHHLNKYLEHVKKKTANLDNAVESNDLFSIKRLVRDFVVFGGAILVFKLLHFI